MIKKPLDSAEYFAEIDAAKDELTARIIKDLKEDGRAKIEVGGILDEDFVDLDMVDVFQHALDNLPTKGEHRDMLIRHLFFFYKAFGVSIKDTVDKSIESLAEHAS